MVIYLTSRSTAYGSYHEQYIGHMKTLEVRGRKILIPSPDRPQPQGSATAQLLAEVPELSEKITNASHYHWEAGDDPSTVKARLPRPLRRLLWRAAFERRSTLRGVRKLLRQEVERQLREKKPLASPRVRLHRRALGFTRITATGL